MPRLLAALLIVAAACGAVVGVAAGAPLAAGERVLMNVAQGGSEPIEAASEASIDGAGQRVVFDSCADGVAPGDVAGVCEVYLRDRVAGTTTLVSRASGAGGAAGDANSVGGSVSADGRWVTFRSFSATPLAPGGDGSGVYIRDLQAATTTFLAPPADGLGGGDIGARVALSPDGSLLLVRSSIAPVSGRAAHTFLVPRAGGPAIRVARRDGLDGAAATSLNAEMSADGTKVVFLSDDQGLAASEGAGPCTPPNPGDLCAHMYLRDVAAGTTTLVSRASGAAGASSDRSVGGLVHISPDGTEVGWIAPASNLDPGVAEGAGDAWVRDLATGTTTLVSRRTDGSPVAGTLQMDLADGGIVALLTFGSLVPAGSSLDDNGEFDVYLRDTAEGRTSLQSRDAPIAFGQGRVRTVSVTADGEHLVWSRTPPGAALRLELAGATFASETVVLPDSDGDGLTDNLDGCPQQAGPLDRNGCPAPVSPNQDGDELIDIFDGCPTQPGPLSNNGCPVASPPGGGTTPTGPTAPTGPTTPGGGTTPITPGPRPLALRAPVGRVLAADARGVRLRVRQLVPAAARTRPVVVQFRRGARWIALGTVRAGAGGVAVLTRRVTRAAIGGRAVRTLALRVVLPARASAPRVVGRAVSVRIPAPPIVARR